tara:strand:+ start:2399 stop:2629 length:231 start_codon:yes stop_codon:yes gene_type:complete
MSEVNYIYLEKEGQTYIGVCPVGRESEIFNYFGRWAADVSLNYTWYDAAIMSRNMRKTGREAKVEAEKKHSRRFQV